MKRKDTSRRQQKPKFSPHKPDIAFSKVKECIFLNFYLAQTAKPFHNSLQGCFEEILKNNIIFMKQ